MFALATAALPLIASGVDRVMSIISGQTKEGVELSKVREEVQKVMIEAQTAAMNAERDVAVKQAEQNITMMQNGNKGPRAFLFWAAALMWSIGNGSIFLVFLVAFILACFGYHPQAITEVITTFPMAALTTVDTMCTMLAGGLYKVRGDEKLSYVKVYNGFNEKTFYDTYRKLNDNNISPEEFNRLKQAVARAMSNQS